MGVQEVLAARAARAQAAQNAPVEVPESGLIGGTVKSLIRGVAQIPVMGGHALEANPEADLTGSPRSILNRIGKTVADTAEGVRDMIPAPNYGTSELKRSFFGGAESLPGSFAYVAPSVVGSLIGQAAVPIPGAGAIAGAAAGSAATYPIMQRSTYQDTYEALKQQQKAGLLKPGTTEADIVAAATKAGHYEAAPEAVTNAAEALLYTNPVTGAAAKVGRRLLSKATGKALAKNYGKSLAIEVPSEMVTGAGQQSSVNEVIAKPTTSPLRAALDSIGPTAVMTGFMAGGGTVGQHLKNRLGTLAQKADDEAARQAALAATGSATPRAAALLATLESTTPDSSTRVGALLNSIPNTGLGTLDPNSAVGPESQYVADAENFPGATDALTARRKEAEAASAAAFDAANPVIPGPAPSAYVPQVIPELGPPPAESTLDLGNVGLPTPASAPLHTVQQDPDGTFIVLDAFGHPAANNFTTQEEAQHIAETLDGISATLPSAAPAPTGPYSHLTPEESDALYQERFAADPDGWIQAMNNRGNQYEDFVDAHTNRLSAFEEHDRMLAARETQQAQTRNEVFNEWANRVSTDPATRQLYGNAAQEVASAMAVEGHDVNGPLDGLDQSVRDDYQNRVQRRLVQMEREQGAPLLQDPTTGAPVSFGAEPAPAAQDQYDAMDYQQLGQEAVRRATGPYANAWDAAINEVEAGSPIVSSRDARYRDAMRNYDARIAAATPQAADPYSNMTPEELDAELNVRIAQNPAMANSCYSEAWDNAPTHPARGEITRAALREYDFRQANPVANNPQNVVPVWADTSTGITITEEQDYATLRDNPDLTAHWRAIKSEVETELVLAGENPGRYENAVRREVLRRFERETTEDVPGTPFVTYQTPNGRFSVLRASNGDIAGVGLGTRADAVDFAHLMNAPANPVPGTAQPTVVTPEDVAPTSVNAVVAGARNFSTSSDFIEWLYGDNMGQPSVATSIDGIYSGLLSERLSRANGWVDSPAKRRLVSLLTALRAAGYESLQEVHEGFDPSSRPAPPPPPTPYQVPPVIPTPASHTTEVVDSVAVANTIEQDADAAAKSSLAKRLSEALSGQSNVFSAEGRTEWKIAFESVFDAVMRKVERFRYGTSSANTVQGIVSDLNAYQRSIGSDLEIKVENGRGQPLTSPGGADIQVRRGTGPWYTAVTTSFGSGGTGATNSRGEYNGANVPTQEQRQPQDGGYGYYALHLIAKNVPGANTSSGGMYPVNQLRRLEHALSFLVRHGGPSNVRIDAEGIGQIMGGDSPVSAIAARSYRRMMNIYPNLIRYTFDFKTGKIKDVNGTVIPVSAITGHARLNGRTRVGGSVGTSRNTHEPQQHVGYSQIEREGFSDSTIIRALITQEVLRSATTASRPGTRRVGAILNAISRRTRNYTDLIFYNRTDGVKPVGDLEVPAIQQALAPITEALKGLIPVEVVQTMAHLPGYHEDMPAFNAAYHNGSIYVIADQVSSVAEAKRLVLDHELRHAGLRQVLGKGMDTFLKQAWYAKTDEIKGFANSKGIDTTTVQGKLEAAEEFVVSLAQEAKSHPLLDRAIAKIRSLLRALGFDLNLSRSELRAMVAKAGMLKERVAADGVTRFSRTPAQVAAPISTTVSGFYRQARDKFKAMQTAARGAEWVTQFAMPIDRLIDLAMLNSVYKPVKALLPVYTRLQREMQNIQDQIVGDAGRRYEHYSDVCRTKAEKDNFNSVMRDGTLWGIFPEGGKLTWTSAEWDVEMKEKTGLTLGQAFADLNGRYKSMTEAQRTQYHAAIKDMEKLRGRYQKSMQDFVKKITAESTLDNSMVDNTINLKNAEGKNYSLKQNDQGMWELRQADGRVIRSELEKAVAAEGFFPQGKREKLLGQVNAKFSSVKGPYAPLSRFGNIVVNVYESTTDPTGEVAEDRVARYHFEKESDAQEMMARMRAEGFKATIEEAAQSKSMRAQVPSEFVTELNGAIERMSAGLEDEQRANISAFGAQIKEDMERIWLSMTPESSALKHSMKRTGLAGFDEDMMRGYVGYAQRHARGIAYLDRGIAIRENIKTMRENIDAATDNSEDARASKRLVDHLENHEATVRGEKLSDMTQKLTRFPFLWYLSSPSVFLVQSAQPFIMTLPKLAVKFGYGKSLTAITKAYAQQANMKDQPFSNKRLEAWEQTAELYVNRQFEGLETASLAQGLSHEEKILLGLAIAVKRGAIDITMTHEAMNILKGNVKGIGDKITEKAAFLMQMSELMSRKAGFAATFGLEMEKHGDFSKAVDGAIKVVDDTLYNYSRANRPGFMLGNAGRILFQFQIFRVHTLSKMLQLLVSSATGENKKAALHEFSLMMGNTMLAAGVTGLPFLSTVMGAFAYLFGDDDEPWDFGVYMRDLLGDGVVGDALLKGAPALFGMDVSRRIGMGSITDLFSGDPPVGVTGAQLYSYYAGKMLGPLGGVASDVLFKAPEMVKQGMWTELLEQTTPKPVKDLMTGYNTMFGEGKYTGKGKLLVDSADMNIWDCVLAAAGINPTKISNAQESNYNAQKLSAEVTERRGVLQKALQRAVISEDPDKIEAATDAIAEFSSKMPEFAITKEQIASGVKRAMRKEMGLEDKNIVKIKQRYEIGEGA